MQRWKGAVRRFAWQVGGVGLAAGACVVLGVLAFGCGGSAPVRPTVSASPSARATATVDPRVAEVEAAVRRYVQALVDSMRTGSADEVGALTVPGSQAAGNAGVAAHVVHDTGKCFITTTLTVTSVHVLLAGSASALAQVSYTLTGYDAAFPSDQPLSTSREVSSSKDLELQLQDIRWLVSVEH